MKQDMKKIIPPVRLIGSPALALETIKKTAENTNYIQPSNCIFILFDITIFM